MTAKAAKRLFASLAAAVVVGTGLMLSACNPKTPEDNAPLALVEKTVDPHSYARPQEARVSHVDLDLTADFQAKVLKGTATLSLITEANAKQVILDTRALDIESVTDASGSPLKFTLGKGNAMMGKPLTIELPQGAQKIVVKYKTTKDGTALQWLAPEQTAGKKQPFLFSQGEEIHTRTWIPTQDSPAIRQTYSARIVVPRDLMAVMSAERLTPDGEKVAGHANQRAYRFEMKEAIAPYLIAIAIGDLGFKAEGSRTGVFAEKATLDAAAAEFTEMQAMLEAAEKLYGPYKWGRYDVLVLPPSFPFGGMENPTLTFATPTILAGDKSLVSLIAHELAHSWSGNLVTNATWEDFWLNEGFTVYFEGRIMEAVYGKDRADMLRVLGWQDLQGTLKDLNDSGQSDFTRLHPDLRNINPDDYFSDVPYEKGAAFIRMLEAHFGRKKLDAYIKGYFQRFAFKSMTTEAFLVDLRTHLLHNDADLERQLKINAWLYDKGMPDNAVTPTSPLLNEVSSQVLAFMEGTPAKALSVKDYSSPQWQYFLTHLPDNLSPEQMADLDSVYGLSRSHNSEILFAWLQQAIKHHYQPALPAVREFLLAQGRRKYVQPIYKSLMAQPGWGVDMAKSIYAEARPLYHDVTRSTIDDIVK